MYVLVVPPQGNVLGTSLNSGPLIAHNVPILAARLPFYYSFLDMSTFIVLLAVSTLSAWSAGISQSLTQGTLPGAARAAVYICS
jgi:hypothetical protein